MNRKHAASLIAAVLVVAALGTASGAERTKVPPRKVFRSAASIVEFRGTEGQARLELTAISKTEAGQANAEVASYTKSATRTLSAGYGNGLIVTRIPPLILRRVLKTDELSVTGGGYELLLSAVNQALHQVNRRASAWGTWEDKVRLDFGKICPEELNLSFDSNYVRLIGGAKDTLMITVTSKPFTMLAADARTDDDIITGYYKAVIFYSPRKDLCYLAMSCLSANRGGETVRVERCAYLSSPDGKWTVAQIPNSDSFLGLANKPIEITHEVPMPAWALQAVQMGQVVSVVALAAACKSAGPVAEAVTGEEGLQIAFDATKDSISKSSQGWVKEYVDGMDKLHSALQEAAKRTGEKLSSVAGEKLKTGALKAVEDEAKDQATKFMVERATEGVNPVINKPLENLMSQLADDAAECENQMLQALRMQNTLKKFMTDLAKNVLGSLPSSVQQAAGAGAGEVAGGGWNLGSALTDAELAELKTRPDSTSLIKPIGEALTSAETAGLGTTAASPAVTGGGSWIGGHPILIGVAAAGVVGVAATGGGSGGGKNGGGGGNNDGGGSSFQGSMSGTWSGNCSGLGNVGGSFTLYVSSDGSVSGSFNGSTSGSISGHVSSGGSLSASGSAYSGSVQWTGTLRGSGSSLSGSGGWSGAGCGGSWSGS